MKEQNQCVQLPFTFPDDYADEGQLLNPQSINTLATPHTLESGIQATEATHVNDSCVTCVCLCVGAVGKLCRRCSGQSHI